MFVLGLGTETRRGKLLRRDSLVLGSDHGRLRKPARAPPARWQPWHSGWRRGRGFSPTRSRPGGLRNGPRSSPRWAVRSHAPGSSPRRSTRSRRQQAGLQPAARRFTCRDRRFGLEVSPPADLDQPLLDAKRRATGNQGPARAGPDSAAVAALPRGRPSSSPHSWREPLAWSRVPRSRRNAQRLDQPVVRATAVGRPAGSRWRVQQSPTIPSARGWSSRRGFPRASR